MTYAEFKSSIEAMYKSVFPSSACNVSIGPLGGDSIYVTYYLAGDQSEFPNRIALNDLFDITFCIFQDGVKYGDGVKLTDDTEMPQALILDVNHKSIKTAPENQYMAYGSVSLPFRKTKGTPDKILSTLQRYAEITKQTLTELYELEKLPTNQNAKIVDFVKSKLNLAESKQVNNMKIKFNKTYNKYQVITPDGRVLEEFDTEKEATDWASKQKDFVVKKEDVEYISKDELDKIPDDYKTTVGDTIKYSWEDKDMLRKKYKDLGYDEADPMILARDDKAGTILKPVKVKETEAMNGLMSENSTAQRLYDEFVEFEDLDTEKWNNAESQEERDAMALPFVKEFYAKHREAIDDNWEDFMELLEFWNFHTEYKLFNDVVYDLLGENKKIKTESIQSVADIFNKIRGVRQDIEAKDGNLDYNFYEKTSEIEEDIERLSDDEKDIVMGAYNELNNLYSHYAKDDEEPEKEAVKADDVDMVREGLNIDDVKDIDDRKFFSILFQLDKLRLFEVNYVRKQIYKGAIGKTSSTFEPTKVVDEITMHTMTLQKGKKDFQSIGYEDEVLANYPKAKAFYDKWKTEIFHSLPEDKYNELLQDIEVLKSTYNYVEEPNTKPDDYGFRFSQEVELSKMQPKNKIGEAVEQPENMEMTAPVKNHAHCDECLEDFEYEFDPKNEVSNDIEIYTKDNGYAYYAECPNCGNLVEVPAEELDLVVTNVDDITRDGFYMEVMDRHTARKCWYEVWRSGDDWEFDFNQFMFHLDMDTEVIAKMFQDELLDYADTVWGFISDIIDEEKLDELEEAKKPVNEKAKKLRELKAKKASDDLD